MPALPAPLSLARSRPALQVLMVNCNAYSGKNGNINESVNADRLMVRSLFQENISEPGWRIDFRYAEINGVDATKDNIFSQCETLGKTLREDDTFYVHFSGHGSIPDRTTGRQVLYACDLGKIQRDIWAGSIHMLPCRLKILVTDCCSSFHSVAVAEGDEDVAPWSTLHSLFMNHRGFVDITAASPGQAAYGTQVGGYLTVNLSSDMQRYSEWDTVFTKARDRVADETEARCPSKQVPMAYSLAQPFSAEEKAGRDLPAYILPESSTRKLHRAEIDELGLMQLYLARNEILARHGNIFEGKLLKHYFGTTSWYRPNKNYMDSYLSAVESSNASLILSMEKEKGGPFIGDLTTADILLTMESSDIFAYSSTKILTRAVLDGLSLQELCIARNEIFARHGYIFNSLGLRLYFQSKYGYKPESSQEPIFNDVERQNLWLIQKLERIRGGPLDWE